MDQTDIRQSPQEITIATKATKTVLIVIFITLLANTFFSNGLFAQSLNSIIKFQSSATQGSTFFFNVVSLLANTIFVIIVIGILFMTHRIRIRILVFLSFFIFNTYLMTILKATYHQARPFWYAKSIKQLEWTCPRQYGNPSGHSWLVVVLYELLLTDFLKLQSKLLRALKWMFFISIFILVPFSRMYLGAHSGNQVFFGLLMGVSMVTLYRFSIQKYLYILFQNLIDLSSEGKKKYKIMFLVLVVQSLLVVLPMVIYIYSPTEDFQYILILNQKCPDRITTSIGLNGGILFTSMLISLVFGFMYALLFTSSQNLLYLYGKWELSSQRSALKNNSIKLAVEVVLITFPLVLVLILKQVISGVMTKYIIFSVLITLSGFLFMLYSQKVLKRYRIIKLKEKNSMSDSILL